MLTSPHIFWEFIPLTVVSYLYGVIQRIVYLIFVGPYYNVNVTLFQHWVITNGTLNDV